MSAGDFPESSKAWANNNVASIICAALVLSKSQFSSIALQNF